jgi:hypothetical protein
VLDTTPAVEATMNPIIAVLALVLMMLLRFGLPLAVVVLCGWIGCRISDRRFARINST